MDTRVAGEMLAFEGWHFERRTRVLSRENATEAGKPIPVGSRALDILALLLERPGTLVSKDAIMDAVWPDVAVEPNNLTVQIAALRRVLDEGRPGEAASRQPSDGVIDSFFLSLRRRKQLPRRHVSRSLCCRSRTWAAKRMMITSQTPHGGPDNQPLALARGPGDRSNIGCRLQGQISRYPAGRSGTRRALRD